VKNKNPSLKIADANRREDHALFPYVVSFFYFEKINVCTKKGLGNSNPALCSTAL
jgi:hypothetical protein